MRSLLYYLPGLTSVVSIEQLRGLGLGYAFESDRLTRVGVGCGPCGSPGGVVVSAGDEVGFHPDCQTWTQIPGRDIWVGRHDDQQRLAPEELARARPLDGHLVRLADGQDWLIPVARGLAERDGELLGWYPALPQGVTLDAEGQWQRGEVLPVYQALWKTACRWWDAYHAALPEAEDGDQGSGAGGELRLTLTFADKADAAVQALAANYRVDRAEVSLLGLLDDASIREVLDALVDWPTLSAWLKKKAPSTAGISSSADGPPGATPTIDPA